MARPIHTRKVLQPPTIKGLSPIGLPVKKTEAVIIKIEEFEVVRLLDYEMLTQLDASRLMCVSRPTLTRIYESARQKMAKALMESKKIVVSGGNASYLDRWFECDNCGSVFNTYYQIDVVNCTLCNSHSIVELTIG